MLHHIWFATKQRKWLLQGDVEMAVREQFQAVARERGLRLLEYELMVDHVHLLLDVEPSRLHESVRLLKGGVAYRIFRQFPLLKLDEGVAGFWQRRFGARSVPEEQAEQVGRYIRTQWEPLEKYEQ
ncbi:MAG: IS200/IS605 family transposase [Dehalococcoidia bacterium]|nr:IS200/IS605 family transposase [Dehalococcoidia bacterium]